MPLSRDSSDLTGEELGGVRLPAWEAVAPSSALGGVPATSLWTSSAELARSSSRDAQLPATRRGVLDAGTAGFVEPEEVLGVSGAGGVNPVTDIAFHGQC